MEMSQPLHPIRSRQLALALACACLSAGAMAQQIYRSVGPGGRVIYSDTPPSAQEAGAAPESGGERSSNPALPYALEQTRRRYPVILYTASACEPCDLGRRMLVMRGVPFTEKTVETDGDIAAFQKLAATTSLPLLAVGSQQVKGFSEIGWVQYLDAAGYPKSSQLPRNWRQPVASPLTSPAVRKAEAAPAADAQAQEQAEPQRRPSPAPNTNPAGIRF